MMQLRPDTDKEININKYIWRKQPIGISKKERKKETHSANCLNLIFPFILKAYFNWFASLRID